MTVQTLRDAAKVLRERAENATPEYGWNFHDGGTRGDGTQPGDSDLIAFISLMSPTVGLALADLLDMLAGDHEQADVDGGTWDHGAMPLARAILGGDA